MMKRFTTAASALALLVAGPASAQQTKLKQINPGDSLPHAAGLSALRAMKPGAAAAAVRDYYSAPGDAPALTYAWQSTCPGTPDNFAQYIAPTAGGSGCWSAASDPNVSNPKEWGAKCDNSTLDQTAMQNALTAAEKLGINFPVPGKCVVSGLTINTPVRINGAGDQSQIVLASGSSAPAVSIAIPSTAAGVIGGYANVVFEDLTITSPNRDDANKAQEHGITATNGSPSVLTTVTMINVKIAGIPGDALHLVAFSGKFILLDSQIVLPGQNGLYCNSSTDANILGGEFYGAEQNNWLLSGCSNTKIENANEYVAQQSGVVIYNSGDVNLINDTMDTAGRHSVNITNQSGQVVNVIGGLIRWSSSAANATYYDINSDAGNLGTTNLFGVHFPTPASSSNTNKPAGNVGFYNSSSAPINCLGCVFDLGPIGTAGITNSATGQLYASATPIATSLSGLRTLAAGQAANVIRLGYASAGDAPPLHYVWQSTCPGTSDNRALYIAPNAGGSGCWSAAADPNVSDVLSWGVIAAANNTYASANATALNAATTGLCAAGLGRLHFTAGHYRYSSAVTVACPMSIYGDGQYNTYLETTDPNQNGIVVTTAQSVVTKDLQFGSAVTPASGGMLNFSVSGGNNQSSVVSRVVFAAYANAIIFNQANHWIVDGDVFYGNVPGSIALDISNTYNVDAGDSTLINNFIAGYTSNTQGVVYRSSGGLRVKNNKFVNLATDLTLNLASGATTSDLLIQGNSFEGFTGQAIRLLRAGATGRFDNIHVQDNQFAEPQSWTNMLTYTSAIGGTNWTKNNVTSALNAYASPDGNTAASSFTATAQYGNIVQSVTLAANTQYTFSVYAQLKSGTNAAPVLVCYDGTYHTQAIAPVLNTWGRYSVTWTTNGAPSGASTCAIQDSGASAWATYAIWGAQLEVGGYAKAYVPVTTTTLAYAAPIIEVDPDGNGSWISKLTATGNSFDANTANATNFAISSLNGWLYDGNISNCAGTCTQFVSTPNAQWGHYGVNPVDGSTGTFTANITGSPSTTTHTTTAAGGG